ncbi:MAG: glycosyltransferase [Anaerolineae bacterium]
MRIAMLSVHTCPLAALGGKQTGGMNVYVRELSRELGRRGVQVDCFTRSENPAVSHIDDTDLGPNVRVIHVVSGPEAPASKSVIWQHLPSFVDGVRHFARREDIQYHVIHSHYWFSGWVAWMLESDWPSVPIVHMFHTLGHLKNLVAQTGAKQEMRQRVTMETEIMRFADRLVAATPRDREQMITFYGADPTKIAVIPPGVDLELFRPIPQVEAKAHLGLPAEHRMILFVGRIEPLKGLDTLIRAMARLVEKEPLLRGAFCVCIIGGEVEPELMDDEMRRLNRLRGELGISDVVTFLGSRDQTELPYYYSAAEMIAVPSYYESFGMVALEAMACGTPVIASDVGGLSFIVRDGETGFLIPERDTDALAEKMLLFLSRPELRDDLGSRGVEIAQGYAWSSIARQILSLYREVLPPDIEDSTIVHSSVSADTAFG